MTLIGAEIVNRTSSCLQQSCEVRIIYYSKILSVTRKMIIRYRYVRNICTYILCNMYVCTYLLLDRFLYGFWDFQSSAILTRLWSIEGKSIDNFWRKASYCVKNKLPNWFFFFRQITMFMKIHFVQLKVGGLKLEIIWKVKFLFC